MSSVSSDQSGLDFLFRRESICDGDSVVEMEIANIFLELRKKHPECSRMDEIMGAVSHCKERLKECMTESSTDLKQMFLDKMVQLGLEKQALEDSDSQESSVVVHAKGHEFIVQKTRGRRNPCCEVCLQTIWRMVQCWRRCKVCGLRAHDKCFSEVIRVCSGVAASRSDFFLVTSICEEKGLAAQNYSCAECCSPLAYDAATSMEPRLCEYTGLLFCPNCHWGDQWSIPARIIHNMDAKPRPVCRAAKQLLYIVDRRPLIDLSSASPSLIKYHKELKRVQQMRRNFLYMKCYFISCQSARKLRILQHLNKHQHFVEGADMYSLSELRELCLGDLLRELEDIYTVFRKHIEEECETCKGNGFYCEMCEDPERKDQVLFPFSDNVSMCQQCLAVFHSKCFQSFHCSRCERRRRRVPIDFSNADS